MRFKAFVILYILLSCTAYAQLPTRAELETRRKQLLESIKQTEEQLEATKLNKKSTLGQLRALQSKLAERQRLIGNINDEIGSITSTIQESNKEVGQLRKYLEIQKTKYAQSLRYSYESRGSYDMLAFIFSAQDFNDAVRRVRYLKKYRDYREEQVQQIRVTQGQIEHKIGVLNVQKNEKDALLGSQMVQKQVLVKETNETDAVVKDLKGQEKQLLAEIDKNRKTATRINKAISEVIRREIEAEQRRAEEEARRKTASMAANNNAPHPITGPSGIKTGSEPANNGRPVRTPTSYNLVMTPEATALSNSFEANHGRLPWPVEKGFVADHFGVHRHPVEEKVMIEQYGIDIRTSANASARAVFEGKVTSVVNMGSSGWLVIISHGRYFTVYGGLAAVSVHKEQQVSTKQSLGTVGPNDDGEPTINFQIWKVGGKGDRNKVDPEPWIAR
ncbi:MAG: peptidoglycan DD-metalloendopeptidase family protein [Taibaiella sp.]|nr:peptidoglycan DD-metalloendopeptidase family protein [Taibaiella sp.]